MERNQKGENITKAISYRGVFWQTFFSVNFWKLPWVLLDVKAYNRRRSELLTAFFPGGIPETPSNEDGERHYLIQGYPKIVHDLTGTLWVEGWTQEDKEKFGPYSGHG